jgi:hypothetical protein
MQLYELNRVWTPSYSILLAVCALTVVPDLTAISELLYCPETTIFLNDIEVQRTAHCLGILISDSVLADVSYFLHKRLSDIDLIPMGVKKFKTYAGLLTISLM